MALASRIAEAHIDLQRVGQARRALISAALESAIYETPLTAREELRLLKRHLLVYGRLTPFLPHDAQRLMPDPVEGPYKLAIVIANLARPLAAMDRYERRALSRRKSAIRAFERAHLVPTIGTTPAGNIE